MLLSDHSECKIQKMKMDRDYKILQRKIEDLTIRNKDLEENYQKIKSEKTATSESSLENSVHFFDG